MIVEKMVPEVYYRESRDFAYVGRLIEILLNYIKTGADCTAVRYNTPNLDTMLLDLYANMLGFNSKHHYNNTYLQYIISSFSTILRNKGSLEAIENCLQLLFNSQGIQNNHLGDLIERSPNDRNHLLINIPNYLTDTILLEDLFNYVLPAGMTYQFNKISDSLGIIETEIFMNTYDNSNNASDNRSGLIANIGGSSASQISIANYDALSNDENDLHGHLGSINTGIVTTSNDTASGITDNKEESK